MRSNEPLDIEYGKSWQRLQEAKEFFHDGVEEHFQERYRLFLEGLMLYDRQQFLQVKRYERGRKRRDQANGFYTRWQTSKHGSMELKVPRTRSGRFQTKVLERYKRRTAAVDEALKQVFLCGVSTRQTGAALASLLDERISASTVSEVSKMLDEQVKEWHHRPLKDHYEYLIFDAVSVRIRLVEKVQKRQALCAFGITAKGQRELIDFQIATAESEEAWHTLLSDLYRRGIKGKALILIATDGNTGLAKAVARTWPHAAHQRCWAHKLRNVEGKLKKCQSQCLDEAKLIYQAPHRKAALKVFLRWKERWDKEAPKAVACLEEDLEQMLAFYDCPPNRWKKIRTTNIIERLFVEVRRRIRTMCSFTTRSSCERILYSVFKRMNTNWEKKLL